jgi:hypothetical protein
MNPPQKTGVRLCLTPVHAWLPLGPALRSRHPVTDRIPDQAHTFLGTTNGARYSRVSISVRLRSLTIVIVLRPG